MLKRIMSVFGTRPEAIKMAPLLIALSRSEHFLPVVVVTAQHRRMLDQVLEVFGIQPDVDLNIIEERQSLTGVTLRALEGLSPVIERHEPDGVVVQGDTSTAFVAALAAFYHQIPVVHLEAGLRTFDSLSPYPEEINRRLITQLASLHLAPTSLNKSNLVAENVEESCVMVTGNTVIDALLWTLENSQPSSAIYEIGTLSREILLVTAHRRESWGRGLESISRALATIARDEPELMIVFPIHKNPKVRECIEPSLREFANVHLIEPLDYGDFAWMMKRARLILTDSGGVQEEAPSLGKPVLVMRETSERPEAINAGSARLVGAREESIVNEVLRLLRDTDAYEAMANVANPYGDGRAADRALCAIEHLFGMGPPPDAFEEPSSPRRGQGQ